MELGALNGGTFAGGFPANNAPLMERYGSVVKELTDPSYLIPLIENDLRRIREVRNDTTKGWEVQQLGEPLLNDIGISNVMALARVAVNNISVLNELSNDVIVNTMRSISRQLVTDLMLSRKEYGIRNGKDRNLIVTIVLTPIWTTLNRSREGGERNWLQNKPGFMEPQQANNSGGFWNIFQRRGR